MTAEIKADAFGRRPVFVITGASSGIGRATALEAARRGYRVVLAARRADLLEEAAAECRRLGGEAKTVPTDVSRDDEVERLAQAAVGAFGRIDLWFNNAGVGVFGRFEDLPPEVWRRVIDVNLLGYVAGARAALRVFRSQGHGVLVQNASIVGVTAKPESTPYVTTKFAIRGFSEALRQELLDDRHIHVCTVLPAAMDTPFFQHAANYSGRKVQAAPPVYPPERVAGTVVELLDRPKAETIVGAAGKFGALLRLADGPATWALGRALHRAFFQSAPSGRSEGNLFRPAEDRMGVSGGWGKESAGVSPKHVAVALAVAPLALGMARRFLRGRRG